jgi:hypothetical protein
MCTHRAQDEAGGVVDGGMLVATGSTVERIALGASTHAQRW